jgi:hypothetical protein
MRAPLLIVVLLILLGLFALPLLFVGRSSTSVLSAVPVSGTATPGAPISVGTGEWLRAEFESTAGQRNLNRELGALVDRLSASTGLSNGPIEGGASRVHIDLMLTEEVGFETALPSITLAAIEVFELRDGLEDLSVRATHLAVDGATVIAERRLVWDEAGARWQ